MKESKKLGLRIVSLAVCLTIACGGSIAAVRVSGSAEEDTGSAASSSSSSTAQTAAAGGSYKDETVYVLARADGSAQKILVSDWIQNPAGETSLSDRTDLEDVSCVKGDTSYTLKSGGARVWEAQGGDVYYQGTSQSQLPVEVTVRYTLDGQPIPAEELAGKSGHVTIRFEYKNTQTVEAEIDGKSETVHVPFTILTGMILDNSHFHNVEVSNGKLINDGDRTIVAGLAIPGLAGDLKLDQEVLELPESVEITADAEDFTLSNTVTLASCGLFGELDLDGTGADELSDAMDRLTSAMDQLLDGSSALYDGLNTLLEKSGELISGIDQLAEGARRLSAGASDLTVGARELQTGAASLKDGAAELKAGLDALTANNATLNAGAKQVFDSLLAMADTQLKSAGLKTETLTIENYAGVLDGVLASLDESSIRRLAYNTAYSQVSSAVSAQKGTIREQVSLAVQEKVLSGVLAAAGVNLTTERYAAAVSAGQIPAETAAQISAAVNAKMQDASIQAQIEDATAQQAEKLIEENMNSSDVQSQIDNAVRTAKSGETSISALKAQLDSYNQFYQGLQSYTAGVAAADTGAAALDAGAGSLKDGAAALKSGADSLKTGADSLSDGMDALCQGGGTLVSGVTQLRDGAMQLSDGLQQFQEEGIRKLTSAFGGNLGGMETRLRAVCDAAANYQSYGGILDGMDGQVKFIYRTESIGE